MANKKEDYDNMVSRLGGEQSAEPPTRKSINLKLHGIKSLYQDLQRQGKFNPKSPDYQGDTKIQLERDRKILMIQLSKLGPLDNSTEREKGYQTGGVKLPGGYPKSDKKDFMKRMGYYQAGGLATPPMYGDNTIPGVSATAFTTYKEADQSKLDALDEQLTEERDSTAYMDEANAQIQADMAKRNTIEQGVSSAVEKGAELKESGALKDLGAKLGIGLSDTDKFTRTTGRATDALKRGNVNKFNKLMDKSQEFVSAPEPSSLLQAPDTSSLSFSTPTEGLSLSTPNTSPLSMSGVGVSGNTAATLGTGMSKVVGSGAFQGAANVGNFLTTGIGGASKVGSMINPAMIATLAGEGIKKISDDDDATTFNAGEVTGSVLSGIGTGAGMGAMIGGAIGGPLAPITATLGAVGGGLYAAGKGLVMRGKGRSLENKAEGRKTAALNKLGAKKRTESLKSKEYSGFDFGTTMRYGGAARPSMRLGGGSRLMKYRDGGFKLGTEVFRNGGVKLPGGMMKPIPGSEAVEFKGKSHEQGGIMLDSMTEVEGGETMGPVTMKGGGKGDYFFSEHLKLGGKSFSQRHKELLKYGGTQKHIDELAVMQEKVAGRDPKQIAATGGPRKFLEGGPRPDIIKKMEDKGFIYDANANNGQGAFVRGTDVTRKDRTNENNMTSRNAFLSDADVNAAVEKLADELGVSTDEVLDIIEAESVYDSSAVNPTSGATGLIQFMPDNQDVNYKTIGGKQYTMSQIASMTPVQQIELAGKYFKGVGYKANSGKPLYLAVAYPEALTTRANDILITSDTKDPKQKAILDQNPNWLDADGNLTGASIASYGAPDSSYGNKDIQSTAPEGSIDIGDRVLLDDEAEYYKSLSPEQKEEYKTFTRDNRNNPNELFMGDEDVVGNVDFDDDDLAANYSNRKDLVNARMGDIKKPNKPRKNDYYSKSRYAKDGSRLKPGKTRDVFEEELYKNAMSEYSSSLDIYKNSKSAANEFADSKGYRSNLQKVGDFTRKNDIGTMAATGLQFIPAAMAYKDKPDYMANPTDIRNVDLERVSYNTERASNAADSNAMSKFIETSGMGPAGIIAKMASYRQKQEGDMKIASDEARANTAIANQEAMINRQIDSDNTKNDMVVDEFNRAADASTKDRKLEAVNNAVQTIAGINRDRLARKASDRMALAMEGTTGVLDRFDLRLQASQIAGSSSGDEYNNVLQQLQLQQQVQMQNNPLLQRLGGKRYGK